MGEKGNVAELPLESASEQLPGVGRPAGRSTASSGPGEAPPEMRSTSSTERPPLEASAGDARPPESPTATLDAVPLDLLKQSPDAMNVWFAGYLRERETREGREGSEQHEQRGRNAGPGSDGEPTTGSAAEA